MHSPGGDYWVLDPEFWILVGHSLTWAHPGFRILDFGFEQPGVRILDSGFWILDSGQARVVVAHERTPDFGSRTSDSDLPGGHKSHTRILGAGFWTTSAAHVTS